jgi:hypothetical protein
VFSRFGYRAGKKWHPVHMIAVVALALSGIGIHSVASGEVFERGVLFDSSNEFVHEGYEECVRVIFVRVNDGPVDTEALGANSIEPVGRYRNLMECRMPTSCLPRTTNIGGEEFFVRSPHRPIPCVVSEGVDLAGADDWHAHGFTGEGAKVAVIDVGFIGLANAIAAGEIPAEVTTVDFTGYGMESLGQHGTAVAEIVYDMAPDAELTLMNTYSEVDLGNAKDYCIENGIHVINHSVGYANTGGHDGTGIVCDIANDAAENGILWVNAIGNHAYNHYRGVFMDSGSDSLHDFAGNPAVEFNSLGALNAGNYVYIYLSWSDWPTTSEDYDLYLYRNNGASWEVVASSCTRQTGSQPPTEEIGFTTPTADEYAVAVKEYDTTNSHELTIVSAFHALQYRTPAGSLLQPADAVGAFAVSAIAKENWTTGPQEGSSSQGPTYDGRMKPEIAGPDRVANYTGGSNFSGTSAASPHVAGAAALVIGAFPTWNQDDVWSCLTTHAVDMGIAGQDSLYGWGRLDLPLSIDVDEPVLRDESLLLTWAYPNPFHDHTTIRYQACVFGRVDMTVYNVAGERVAGWVENVKQPGLHEFVWTGQDETGARLPAGTYFIRSEAGSVTSELPLILVR